MANCTKLFLDFAKEITPTVEQMQKMKNSRKALEEKISDYLQEKLGMTVSYYTQGSGAKLMRTIIIRADGTYDADRGIYLPQEPEVEAKIVQEYVFEAVKSHTDDGAEHRIKCIRVLYKGAYNIDFPVYYQIEGESYSFLATKNMSWIKDDPSKMIEWLAEFKDENGQLIRIIKCLKAWASECSFKMPSGIALAVWAASNFTKDDRDDSCFLQVLDAIRKANLFAVTCISPVEPFDDLTAKLSEEDKGKFKTELSNFCLDAQKAINSKNQREASLIWRKYFGNRFPEGFDEDVDERADLLMASATAVSSQKAKLSREGLINQQEGVQHLIHRNYGGE